MAKLMRSHGIAAKTKRKFRCSTASNHDRLGAGNALDHRFEPGAADRAWAADITYVPTREGWLDLAVMGMHAPGWPTMLVALSLGFSLGVMLFWSGRRGHVPKRRPVATPADAYSHKIHLRTPNSIMTFNEAGPQERHLKAILM
jgi:transposase InsO family protein